MYWLLPLVRDNRGFFKIILLDSFSVVLLLSYLLKLVHQGPSLCVIGLFVDLRAVIFFFLLFLRHADCFDKRVLSDVVVPAIVEEAVDCSQLLRCHIECNLGSKPVGQVSWVESALTVHIDALECLLSVDAVVVASVGRL